MAKNGVVKKRISKRFHLSPNKLTRWKEATQTYWLLYLSAINRNINDKIWLKRCDVKRFSVIHTDFRPAFTSLFRHEKNKEFDRKTLRKRMVEWKTISVKNKITNYRIRKKVCCNWIMQTVSDFDFKNEKFLLNSVMISW